METSESKSDATDNNLKRITRPSVTLSPRTRRSLKYVSYECYLNGAFNERGNELRSFRPVGSRDVALRVVSAARIASNIAKLPELLPPKSDEHAEKKAVRILD